MALSLSQLLSGAGTASTAMRKAEEAERVARTNQLALEEQNRLEALKAEMARAQLESFRPATVPSFAPQGVSTPAVNATAGADKGIVPVEYIAPSAAASAAGAPQPGRLSPAPAAAPTAVAPLAPSGGMPTMELTAEQFQALTPAQRLQRLQVENDRRRLAAAGTAIATGPAAAADIFVGAPVNAIAAGGTWLANQLGVARLGKALGVYDPDVERVEIPRIGTGTGTPFTDELRKAQAALAPLTEEQLLEQLRLRDASRTRLTGAKETEATRLSSERAQKRLTDLANSVPQALGAQGTQAVIARAQALGVDPASAVAIYGIETSFGATTATSSKGAKGPMQVMDDTFRRMKTFFTNEENIRQYNIPPAVSNAAATLVRGNPQSEIDAGLLVLKYNELIGVPKNLWGAGYQGNADRVKRAGRPLNVSDGGLSNTDYNNIYVSLYNQVAQGMQGGAAPTMAAAPAAGAPPGAPATPPVPAAPATPGAAPIPATAAGAPVAGAPIQVTISGTSDFYLANPQTIPYEQQRLDQAFQQLAMQAQQQAALLTRQRNEAAQLAQIYMRSGTGQGIEAAMRLRDTIGQYDTGLMQVQQQIAQARQQADMGKTYLEGMQGIQELSFANDPRRLAAVWSLYAGVPVGIQPRTDGMFNILVNGKKTKEGVSATDIVNSARLAFDQTYRQQQASAGAAMNMERFKASLESQKEQVRQTAQMIREIAVERVKGGLAQALEWAKSNYGWDIKPSGSGDGTVLIRPPGGVPHIFNPTGRTVEIDGVKIQSSAAYPIAGLPSFGGTKPQ